MNNVNMIKFESITTISDETLQTIIGGDHIPNSGGGGALPIGRNIFTPADLPGPNGSPYYGSSNQYRNAGRHWARN